MEPPARPRKLDLNFNGGSVTRRSKDVWNNFGKGMSFPAFRDIPAGSAISSKNSAVSGDRPLPWDGRARRLEGAHPAAPQVRDARQWHILATLDDTGRTVEISLAWFLQNDMHVSCF